MEDDVDLHPRTSYISRVVKGMGRGGDDAPYRGAARSRTHRRTLRNGRPRGCSANGCESGRSWPEGGLAGSNSKCRQHRISLAVAMRRDETNWRECKKRGNRWLCVPIL